MRAMSAENVETVRRGVDVFNKLGFDGLAASDLCTDDVEFHEPPEQPAPRVAHGREEFRRIAGEFDAAWAEHVSEPKEIRAVDQDRVLYESVSGSRLVQLAGHWDEKQPGVRATAGSALLLEGAQLRHVG